MYNNSKIAKAIRAALIITAGATAAFSATTFAEEVVEEVVEEIEKIQVTGSRISQVDLENSSPITVITAADISLSGSPTVADVLNNLSANAFGSWTGVSGYGSGAAASSNINLRGLGSDATLVLIDGRRMPGDSSSSGSSADTSIIPMSIVERVEILRDGASAIYGSSAVAGVINIITKKDFDGVHAKYEYSTPDVDGGDAQTLSLTSGFNSENGNIIFTYEHSESDAVFDSELWPIYDDSVYSGYSTYGTVPNYIGDDGVWHSNSDDCAEAENVYDATDGADNGRCKYNYGAVTMFYPKTEKNSLFSQFNYELSDEISFVGRALASLNETESRGAGTPVSTSVLSMDADNLYNPAGEYIEIYARADGIGARDTKTEVITTDVMFGLIGSHDIGNGIDWQANYQNSISITNSFSYNLVNDETFQALIDNEEYDIFNTQDKSYDDWYSDTTDAYQAAAHTGVYQARYDSQQIDGFLSTVFVENEDFVIAAVAGAEYEKINFSQTNDPEAANGIISGSSGGDDVDASRERTAAYVEVQASLPYNLDLTVAGRYENYDQEGTTNLGVKKSNFSQFVPKVGLTWAPVESVLVRSSWGESFRAPNMSEMFSSYSLSFQDVNDTEWCEANPNTDINGYCGNAGEQVKTWYGGNQELTAETGESFTAGVVWDVMDNLSLELTYYAIDYDERIGSVSLNTLLYNESLGGMGSTPGSIVRGDDGKIDTIYTGYINQASLSTDGFDIAAHYMYESPYGDFSADLNASYVASFEQKVDKDDEGFDYAGLQDYPSLKGDLALGWAKDDYTASWTMYYVGAQDSGNEEWGVDYYADIPTYVKHNVQFSYTAPTRTRLTLGINNLTDKEAPTWFDGFRDYRDVSWSLYDLTGRTAYFRIEQSF